MLGPPRSAEMGTLTAVLRVTRIIIIILVFLHLYDSTGASDSVHELGGQLHSSHLGYV